MDNEKEKLELERQKIELEKLKLELERQKFKFEKEKQKSVNQANESTIIKDENVKKESVANKSINIDNSDTKRNAILYSEIKAEMEVSFNDPEGNLINGKITQVYFDDKNKIIGCEIETDDGLFDLSNEEGDKIYLPVTQKTTSITETNAINNDKIKQQINEPIKKPIKSYIYILWTAGLLLIPPLAISSDNARNYFLTVGNTIVYFIYGWIVYAIAVYVFKKGKGFLRYMKLTTWTVVLCSGFVLNHKFNTPENTTPVSAGLTKEPPITDLFFKALQDTCEERCVKIGKSKDEAQAGCACLIEKAKKRWTEEDIKKGGIMSQPGNGDSVVKWMNDCFYGVGFMGQ